MRKIAGYSCPQIMAQGLCHLIEKKLFPDLCTCSCPHHVGSRRFLQSGIS